MLKYGLVFVLSLASLIAQMPPPGSAVGDALPVGSLDRLPDPWTLNAPPLKVLLPPLVSFRLSNGIQVFYMEDRELPALHLKFAFKAGMLEDPQQKAGLAEMAVSLLRSGGTRFRSAQALDREIEDLAAEVEMEVGSEMSSGALWCFSRDQDRMVGILAEMLKAPRFDPVCLERSRNRMISELERLRDNPLTDASRGLWRLLYNGKGLGNGATAASLRSIRRGDLIDFAGKWLGPDNITLGICGDLSCEDAKKLMEKHFGSWAGPKRPQYSRRSEATESAPGVFLRKRSGLSQGVVLAGMTGFREGDPDQAALNAAFFVLGEGSIGSRLFNSIRSRHGLAYMVYSASRWRSTVDGVFVIYSSTKVENTSKVLSLIREECRRLSKSGLDPEEWEKARQALIAQEVFYGVKRSNLLGEALHCSVMGLALDSRIKRLEQLQKLDLQSVNDAIRRGFKPENLRYLVVGDPDVGALAELEAQTVSEEIGTAQNAKCTKK